MKVMNQTFVQCTSEKHKNTQLLVLNDLDVLKYDPLFASRLPPLLHPYPTHDMYMKVLSSFGKIFVQILRHFLQF